MDLGCAGSSNEHPLELSEDKRQGGSVIPALT